MQGSKITLSPSEAALFSNAEIILTKNSVLQKTVALLADVQEQMEAGIFPSLPFSTPKISRGENYRGLPYVVLDYPRIAKGEDLLFVRSMFWWGHFFSSTLQLAGAFKEDALWKLAAGYETLAAEDFYVGIQEDPWQHHFEKTNYQKIGALSKEDFFSLLQRQPHTKIAARWPLSQWDSAANLLVNSWKTLLNLVA